MKRLNRNLHGDDPDFHVLPGDSDLAAQYLLRYEFSLPVGRDLNNLIDVERSATRVTVVLKSLSTNEKVELDNRAQAWFRQDAPDLENGASGVAAVGARSIQGARKSGRLPSESVQSAFLHVGKALMALDGTRETTEEIRERPRRS